MLSSIPLYKIINAVVPELTFLWIPASRASPSAVNPSSIKTSLANGSNTFFINGELTFVSGPRSLPRNPSNCIILEWYISR